MKERRLQLRIHLHGAHPDRCRDTQGLHLCVYTADTPLNSHSYAVLGWTLVGHLFWKDVLDMMFGERKRRAY